MRSFARVVAFPDSKIIVFSCRLNTFRADDDLDLSPVRAIRRPITDRLRHVRRANFVRAFQIRDRTAYL
jgi:hypothetical protein